MGPVWETWGVWPGCAGKAIWCHLPPYDHASSKTLSPSKHNSTHDSPFTHPTPIANAPCIDAVLLTVRYVSGHWHYSCMTSPLRTMPLLMLYMSSNIRLPNIFCRHKRGA
ncbi:hypothetical protein CgunFtcFv8_004646 [Champsocephalus gunnari]|uniref:Uncharacterized protein n=1 Tax=Champsocephalus gunnari TaxID=52237 RepID=A0AAN8E1L5_CHAGU|nr:hypothetical protein CgunFtcFv8_004646 [Champsocephalus gunnari]